MVDSHNQSFFGQNTGLFVQSSSKDEQFIFLKLIKKKPDGSWEKLTNKEGIAIKCGLEEIIMILDVLQKNREKWATVHEYNEDKKSISLNWDKDDRLWIHVDNYTKQLVFPQTELFKMLLEHILQEKIEFSTVSSVSNETVQETTPNKTSSLSGDVNSSFKNEDLKIVKERNIDEDITQIQGKVKKETDAALYIEFSPEKELWVAKSKIRSTFDSQNEGFQEFSIDSWILRKNKIIS